MRTTAVPFLGSCAFLVKAIHSCPPAVWRLKANQAACNTRIRSKSSFALPYIWRLISFSRLM